jgi:hypothetical protein
MPLPSLAKTITAVGIAAWGGSMPVLNPRWTNGALPAANDAAMSLTLAAGSWTAPIAGTLTESPAGGIPVTLLGADGTPLAGAGALLLTIHPHAYLRLARLYANAFENETGARPERARGLPFRPVPRYVRFVGAGVAGGNVKPGDTIGVAGDCTFHDIDGLPIDPLAVAAAFAVLMVDHEPLQRRALGATFDTNSQVKQIAALAGAPSVVRIRLADPAGRPHDGANLQGITAVAAAAGLFTLNASAGAASNLTGTITLAAASAGAFPEERRRLVKLGPATTGRLTETFDPPDLPSGVTLARDFFSVRIVDLGPYLRGTPNPNWNGTKVHEQPEVRLNEPVILLADGNDVLGAAAAALDGGPNKAHVAAQTIDAGFSAPPSRGAPAHWPAFPVQAGAPAGPGPLPVNLRDGFAPTAGFLNDGDGTTANVDVVLTLSGLPEEAHVRVYQRLLLPDAREGRGDGAGGIAHAGSLTLLLCDPLRLRLPGLPDSAVTMPTQARLALDVVVVKRTGESRIYGNVVVPIAAPAVIATPAAGGPNPFAAAGRRAISHAGVLGLRPPVLPGGMTDLADVVLALSGEGNPRDSSRLPTMAHRELIVAGLAGGTWKSVLSAGRLAAELHSAVARTGAPGGRGGRETQAVGLATASGPLAYDLARAALRRTMSIAERMMELVDGDWDAPDEPAALAAGAAATETQGTVAAAALQTLAPGCATPEFYGLRGEAIFEPDSPNRPHTFGDLVDKVTPLIPARFPRRKDIVKAMDDQKENPQAVRLFDELEREIMTSMWGRRDTQWALLDAIGRARRFVYIETPGFLPTQKDYAGAGQAVPAYAADLVGALAGRLNAAPGLHVMICTPRHPDFGPGYEPAAAYEAQTRRAAVLGLPTANAVEGSRVVAFHPVGFPGRPSRLEATVVVVDDVWALVGACTLRRRGLTLDGSTDVVLTDMDVVNGACPSLRDFRRALLADRLGVAPSTAAGPFGVMPDASHVRLADGVEAFYVIREQLRAGGLGKIERLWTGITPGAAPTAPLSQDLADPDGEEFPLLAALALGTLASL